MIQIGRVRSQEIATFLNQNVSEVFSLSQINEVDITDNFELLICVNPLKYDDRKLYSNNLNCLLSKLRDKRVIYLSTRYSNKFDYYMSAKKELGIQLLDNSKELLRLDMPFLPSQTKRFGSLSREPFEYSIRYDFVDLENSEISKLSTYSRYKKLNWLSFLILQCVQNYFWVNAEYSKLKSKIYKILEVPFRLFFGVGCSLCYVELEGRQGNE